MKPYKFQLRDIKRALKTPTGGVLNGSIMGAGKSLFGAEVMKAANPKQLLIVAPLNTEDGWRKAAHPHHALHRISSVNGENRAYENAKKFLAGTPGWYFCGWETAIRLEYAKFKCDALILDECFIAGTLISTPTGDKPIEAILPGQKVLGFDHTTGRVITSVVRGVMSRPTQYLLGASTPDHPYYVVGNGYCLRADLTNEDQLYAISKQTSDSYTVRCMPARHLTPTANESAQNLFPGVSKTTQERDDESTRIRPEFQVKSSSQKTYDQTQSGYPPRSNCESTSYQTRSRYEIRVAEWWQRYWNVARRKDTSGETDVGTSDRAYQTKKRQRLSVSLQTRPWFTRVKNWCGMRWTVTYNDLSQGTRQEKRRISASTRLDHLAIQKPRDFQRYEAMREASVQGDQVTVYNLETETNNYFAGGLLVHNCHRAQAHRKAHKYGSNAHMAYTVGRLVAKRGGFRIGLSGTWKGNKEEGAWAVQRAIWPLTTEPSFWRWAEKHLKLKVQEIPVWNKTQRVMEIQEIKVLGDELDSGSIVRELPFYIRHEEDTRCCKFHPRGAQADLPARIPHMIGVDLSPSQRQIYDQLEKDMFAWIEDHAYPISSQGYPMVNLTRLYQVCLAVPSTALAKRLKTDKQTGDKVVEDYIKVSFPLTATSSKIDALLEIIGDIPEGESIIVYTHSAGIIPVILSRINRTIGIPQRNSVQPDAKKVPGRTRPAQTGIPIAAGWHGDVLQADRDRIKADFLRGSIRIIVAQVASIAEGVDGLQDVCHNEIWFSMSADNVIDQQALKRLHRSGQKHPINAFYIYARGTKEPEQFEKLHKNATKMKEGMRK